MELIQFTCITQILILFKRLCSSWLISITLEVKYLELFSTSFQLHACHLDCWGYVLFTVIFRKGQEDHISKPCK